MGVLTAILNFSSLMSSVEEKKNKHSARLTGLFFLRYLLIAVIFAVLVKQPEHLKAFLIGFLSLYAIFFIDYMKRMKAGK